MDYANQVQKSPRYILLCNVLNVIKIQNWFDYLRYSLRPLLLFVIG